MRMRILSILSLITGAYSAALSRLHAGNARQAHLRSQNPQANVALEAAPQFVVQVAPQFIARGFLTRHTNVNRSDATDVLNKLYRHRDVGSVQDIVSIKDRCRKSCGQGIDSGCSPECQVRMYACLDFDTKTKDGEQHLQDCELEVIRTYQRFSSDWESTHPQLMGLLSRNGHETMRGADIEPMQDDCKQACGKGVDTSCVPECQVQLYHCLDYNRDQEEGLKNYTKCKEKVLSTYKKFGEDWDATHPYLLAVGRHTGANELRLIRDKCFADCGKNSKKSCAPRCETARYACLSIDSTAPQGAAALQKCSSEVSAKVAKAEAASQCTVDELDASAKACSSACGLGMDASCMPECQAQMFNCMDESKKKGTKYSQCTQAILAKYETYAADWNLAHPILVSVHGHADAETLEDFQDSCKEACGVGVDSSCVPECQVKMYQCLDHDRKVPEGAKKFKECSRDVLATYEKFADDWEATHPYLLAVRRHVYEAELVRAQDQCEEACGKSVDSTCVPECQVEMYACLDHDRTSSEGAKEYSVCTGKVLDKYRDFGANWCKVHPC